MLINDTAWRSLDEYNQIRQTYTYVRDEILFGYNIDNGIPASKVLTDEYGQGNSKGALFMALLRGVNIPCCIHGFTIDKKLQKGALTELYIKILLLRYYLKRGLSGGSMV